MGADEKVFVHAGSDQAIAAALGGPKRFIERHGWLELEDDAAGEDLAVSLSQQLGVVTAFWSIHTAVDQIWIQAFKDGKAVRALRYSSDEGWAEDWGKPLPFENRKQLSKWKRKKRLAALPDGYDVLDAFLGLYEEPAKVDAVRAVDSNLTVPLPASIVADASAVAARRGVAPNVVLSAAWELGKTALFMAEAENNRHLDPTSARPGPVHLPSGFSPSQVSLPPAPEQCPKCRVPFGHSHGEVSYCTRCGDGYVQGLRLPQTVDCALKLAEPALGELKEMVIMFDQSRSILLARAYAFARSKLG